MFNAEFDGGCVETEAFAFETESVNGPNDLASLKHFAEQGLEEFRWKVVVGVGKGGACHGLRPRKIELSNVQGQIADAVSHGMAARQMDEREAGKQIPWTENPGFPFCRMFAFGLRKNMSRNQDQQLGVD